MSDEQSTLEEGLNVFASILMQIKESSIEIMRVHPVNGLLMMNLLGNIGYTIFAVENENGMYELNQWGLLPEITVRRFASKQELMSFCFRQVGVNAGTLLKADVVGDLFQVFNLGKVMEFLK
jgi:hypothetical protein